MLNSIMHMQFLENEACCLKYKFGNSGMNAFIFGWPEVPRVAMVVNSYELLQY